MTDKKKLSALEAMLNAATILQYKGFPEAFNDLIEAHKAVQELIEADLEYDRIYAQLVKAEAWAQDEFATGAAIDAVHAARDEALDAYTRRSAALKRVKGL